MKTEDKPKAKRRHADFQDPFRRSSNFPNYSEAESKQFKVKGNGELKIKKRNS